MRDDAPPPGARPPRRRRRALFVLLTLGLALVLLELGARVLVTLVDDPALHRTVRDHDRAARGQVTSFAPDPEGVLAYRLTPGWRRRGPGGEVTAHNRAGFRDTEEPGAKAPGTLRIVCIGGSTTYGSAVSANEDTYPARLEERLRSRIAALSERGWRDAEVLETVSTESRVEDWIFRPL